MSILQSSKKLKTGKKNLFDAETDGDAKDKKESGMDTKRIEGRGSKYRDAMIVKGMSGWCPLFHECSWRQEAYTDRGKEKRRKRDTKERTQAKHKGCMQLKTSCESLGKSHRNNPLSLLSLSLSIQQTRKVCSIRGKKEKAHFLLRQKRRR